MHESQGVRDSCTLSRVQTSSGSHAHSLRTQNTEGRQSVTSDQSAHTPKAKPSSLLSSVPWLLRSNAFTFLASLTRGTRHSCDDTKKLGPVHFWSRMRQAAWGMASRILYGSCSWVPTRRHTYMSTHVIVCVSVLLCRVDKSCARCEN